MKRSVAILRQISEFNRLAQIFRSKRRRSEAAKSRLQIGHQQRRRHALSSDVADAYAQRLLPERKNVVIIAAHHACGLPRASYFVIPAIAESLSAEILAEWRVLRQFHGPAREAAKQFPSAPACWPLLFRGLRGARGRSALVSSEFPASREFTQGFSTKSPTPCCIASTARPTVAQPVITTIGGAFSVAFSRASRSSPRGQRWCREHS